MYSWSLIPPHISPSTGPVVALISPLQPTWSPTTFYMGTSVFPCKDNRWPVGNDHKCQRCHEATAGGLIFSPSGQKHKQNSDLLFCVRPEQPGVTALSWRSSSSTEGKLRYYIFIWLQIVDPAYSSVVWNVKCTFFGPTLWPGLFFVLFSGTCNVTNSCSLSPCSFVILFYILKLVVTIFLWNPRVQLWPNSNVVTEH